MVKEKYKQLCLDNKIGGIRQWIYTIVGLHARNINSRKGNIVL